MKGGAQARWVNAVLEERRRQDEQWGDCRGRSPDRWCVILGGEFGEVCEAVLGGRMGGRHGLRNELTQVAAVALSALEFGELNGCWGAP